MLKKASIQGHRDNLGAFSQLLNNRVDMIILDSVTKKFGAFTAVDNVSYSIQKGEFFALLGPNGAGKTTIVRMLLNFTTPSSGSVTINGRSVSDPESRRHIGYIAEQHMIPPYLSGFEYLSRHASLLGLSGKAAEKEVDRVLEMVSMKGPERKKAASYSKGMQQRMGIGAALFDGSLHEVDSSELASIEQYSPAFKSCPLIFTSLLKDIFVHSLAPVRHILS